jgi:hypothetical protein
MPYGVIDPCGTCLIVHTALYSLIIYLPGYQSQLSNWQKAVVENLFIL